MRLYLNEKIKKLRLENNLTQQELSEKLGVSTQAVSRWETNSTFPDIELLPDIASIFEITVDELLGVNDSINNNRVEKCIEEANSYYHSGNILKMVEVLENGIRNNPTNIKLSLKLIETLFSLYNDDREKTCNRIIKLGNKIIDKLKNINDKCSLYQILAYTHLELGNKEQAKMFAEKLPNLAYSKEFILSNIYEGVEKDELIKYTMNALITNLVTEILKLSNSKEYTIDDKIAMLNKLNSLYSLIYENEDYGYEAYMLSKINMKIFNLFIEKKEIDKSYLYLEEAFKYANQFDNLTVIKHTSLLFNKTYFDKKVNFGKDYTDSEVERIEDELKKHNFNDNQTILDILNHY